MDFFLFLQAGLSKRITPRKTNERDGWSTDDRPINYRPSPYIVEVSPLVDTSYGRSVGRPTDDLTSFGSKSDHTTTRIIIVQSRKVISFSLKLSIIACYLVL